MAAAAAALDDGQALEAVRFARQANALGSSGHIDLLLARARHLAFDEVAQGPGREQWPPTYADLTPGIDGLPEVEAAELTSEILGSAITHHGALIVRNLIAKDEVPGLCEGIDRAFVGYDQWENEGAREGVTMPWFSVFKPEGRFHGQVIPHGWVREGGGVNTAESPRNLTNIMELFETVHLRDVLTEYLGERPVISVKKNTLRRVPTDIKGADWHQDGAFLGAGVRAVNVWVSLSHCGGDAPTAGLDVVPRRFAEVLPTGTEGAIFDWSVGPGVVDRESAAAPVIRPEFFPGDALLFDDLLLHRTGVSAEMDFERYALESWFFAPSRYPNQQIPLVF